MPTATEQARHLTGEEAENVIEAFAEGIGLTADLLDRETMLAHNDLVTTDNFRVAYLDSNGEAVPITTGRSQALFWNPTESTTTYDSRTPARAPHVLAALDDDTEGVFTYGSRSSRTAWHMFSALAEDTVLWVGWYTSDVDRCAVWRKTDTLDYDNWDQALSVTLDYPQDRVAVRVMEILSRAMQRRVLDIAMTTLASSLTYAGLASPMAARVTEMVRSSFVASDTNTALDLVDAIELIASHDEVVEELEPHDTVMVPSMAGIGLHASL